MFDFNLALKYLYFAYAAFCPKEQLESWNCQWCDKVPNVQTYAVLESNLTDTYGYVGLWNDSTIILSFRGTVGAYNWYLDFDPVVIYPLKDHPNVAFHKGWWEGYQALRPQIMDAVQEIIETNPKKKFNFLCTGHSLGAALSGIAAWDMKTIFPKWNVSLSNYGMPRVGNRAFSDLFRKLDIYPSWRCVHYHDWVPHLPFEGFPLYGYHISREIWWYTEGNAKKWRECSDKIAEDPTCSDSVPFYEWTPSDHDVYLGVHNDNCRST